ncbi:3706_t:CDS:1, partial [Gigaspora margarita]
AHSGSKYSDEEWSEYVEMLQVRTNETPTEWMNRIWSRLQYFRENDLLPTNCKKYLEARKLITYWSEVNGFYKSYAPEIGIAICFSCNQLVYTGKRTKNIENYNHIGMERHWASHCTGNTFCGVSYYEYLLKIEQKAIYGYHYDNEYALQRYGIWMQNAIKKIERAREVGRKIRACTIIQRRWLEIFYKPEG